MNHLDVNFRFLRMLINQYSRDSDRKIVHLEGVSGSDTLQEKLQPESISSPAGFVSRKDTWIELGPPTLTSVHLILCTHDSSLVHKDQLTIIGNDLPELEPGTYSFAQVFLVSGPGPDQLNESSLLTHLSFSGKIAGCMSRTSIDRIWMRIQKDTIEKGLTFSFIGWLALQSLYRNLPEVEAAEAVFVTQNDSLIKQINVFSRGIRNARREKIRQRFRKVGDNIYECENPVDCEECPDNPVCEVIRETIKVIKKRREEFFGKDTG